MKTTQFFDEKIETATIVVNQNHIDTYKSMLQRRKVEMGEGTFHEKENITVFVVKGLFLSDLHLFDEGSKETCYVHYYVLRRNHFRVKISTDFTTKEKQYTSHLEVGYFEEEKYQKIAEIYSDREILGDKPKGYGVNWGGWGTQSVATTNTFATGIQLAAGLAEDCTRQFC